MPCLDRYAEYRYSRCTTSKHAMIAVFSWNITIRWSCDPNAAFAISSRSSEERFSLTPVRFSSSPSIKRFIHLSSSLESKRHKKNSPDWWSGIFCHHSIWFVCTSDWKTTRERPVVDWLVRLIACPLKLFLSKWIDRSRSVHRDEARRTDRFYNFLSSLHEAIIEATWKCTKRKSWKEKKRRENEVTERKKFQIMSRHKGTNRDDVTLSTFFFSIVFLFVFFASWSGVFETIRKDFSFWTTTTTRDASLLLQWRWRPKISLKHSREKSTDSVCRPFQSLMNNRPRQLCPPPVSIFRLRFWKSPNHSQKRCWPTMTLLWSTMMMMMTVRTDSPSMGSIFSL